MEFRRDLICFRHCEKTIFVYGSISACPLCRKFLSSSLESTPLTLPYPFVRAFQYPCSIVLRPSVGDFLDSFRNQSNLHIGLTSSTNIIFEFDVEGLIQTLPKNVDADIWNQCILVAQVAQSWYDRWDDVLKEVSKNIAWRKENYLAESNNCFTFILNFLQKLEHHEFSRFCHDKLSFSEIFITPKTINAAKYISIHRKLQSLSYWVDDQMESGINK